jgi:hypothetical protein
MWPGPRRNRSAMSKVETPCSRQRSRQRSMGRSPVGGTGAERPGRSASTSTRSTNFSLRLNRRPISADTIPSAASLLTRRSSGRRSAQEFMKRRLVRPAAERSGTRPILGSAITQEDSPAPLAAHGLVWRDSTLPLAGERTRSRRHRVDLWDITRLVRARRFGGPRRMSVSASWTLSLQRGCLRSSLGH